MKIITIAICTFNRRNLLIKCLNSIKIEKYINLFEVLIINNASTDDTEQVVLEYIKNKQNFKYFYEEKIGLSIARNRAISESIGDWLVYIDDDAFLDDNYIERLLDIIKFDYDCIGGNYIGYSDCNIPKWLPKDFGNKELVLDNFGLCNYDVPCGGNVIYKKKAIINLNGFKNDFGMIGNSIAYGEETELQNRLEKNGCKIAYDPELVVFHYISPIKFTLLWQFNSIFAQGRDEVFKNQFSIFYYFYLFFKSLFGLFFKNFLRKFIFH
ncbi:MAG: glycosyltransferase family 2 protein [Saprospiraceae bacterium]|nr:glycosyltransferase family 2 protein [Saprospiraceae bacterium]